MAVEWKTQDGRTGIELKREPVEDPELGVLSTVDSVQLMFPDGDIASFWDTDLCRVGVK